MNANTIGQGLAPLLRTRRKMLPLPDEIVMMMKAQGGVATTSHIRCQLTADRVRRAVRDGNLVRLWRDMYALPAGSFDFSTRLRAADLQLGFRGIPCLHTAALLRGFDISDDPDVHLLSTGHHHSRVPGVRLHRIKTWSPMAILDDRALTEPIETAVMVAARAVDELRALAAIDAAIRSGQVTVPGLLDYLEVSRTPGAAMVRGVVGHADGRAESPPESWLRLTCLRYGLPPPEVQFWVLGADGLRYRLDLAWPDAKVALEYDGVQFHTGEALTKDRNRLNALRAAGWTIYSATAHSLFNDRERLMAMVGSALLGAH